MSIGGSLGNVPAVSSKTRSVTRLGPIWPSEGTDLPTVALLLAAAGAFYLIPWPVLYLPALAAVVLLTWLRLDLALTLVVFFAPYFMVPKHLGSKEFAPSEIFLLIDLAVAAMYVARRDDRLDVRQVFRSPFVPAAVLFLLGATLSTVLAADRHQALQWYRETILEPALFFALLLAVQNSRIWGWLVAALLGAGLSVGLVGIGQLVVHQGLSQVPGTTIQRVRSVYGSPDNLGLLYDRVIPFWLALFLAAGLARGWRVVLGFVGALFFVILALTYSRGAWFAVGIAILFILALRYRRGRWFALVCIGAALLSVVVAGPKLVQAFRTGHAHTTQRRVEIWQSSIRMIRDYPLVGVGPDNFIHYYAPTRKEDLWQRLCAPGLGYMNSDAGDEPCLSHPHNAILDFWLSTGLLGLIAFVWLQFIFWRSGVTAWRRDGAFISRASFSLSGGGNSGISGWTRPVLLLGCMGAMLATLIHGMVDESYFLPDLSILFWFLCGTMAFAAAGHANESLSAE